jgi:hypothetical protein
MIRKGKWGLVGGDVYNVGGLISGSNVYDTIKEK